MLISIYIYVGKYIYIEKYIYVGLFLFKDIQGAPPPQNEPFRFFGPNSWETF